MKKLIVVAIIFMAATSFAAGSLQRDVNGVPVQIPAPSPYERQILTINSTTVDVSADMWWGLYAPTACKYRIMPTSAKASFAAFTAPAATITAEAVNSGTKFVNFSGCTLGELSRQ